MKRVALSFGLVLIPGLLSSGCQLAGRDSEKARETTLAAVREAVEACHRQNLPTFVARAKCRNDAENLARSVYPYPDLLELRLATRLSLAEKTDRGEISNQQASLEFEKTSAIIAQEEQARDGKASLRVDSPASGRRMSAGI